MIRDHGFLINKRYEAAGSLTVGPILGTAVGFKEIFFEDPAVGATDAHRFGRVAGVIHEDRIVGAIGTLCPVSRHTEKLAR